jgi:hypothetical protein
MVSIRSTPPATVEAGLRLLIAGGGCVTVKTAEEEIPETVLTLMPAVLAAAIRLAGTRAVNCVELMNVLGNSVDPHHKVQFEVKFVPFTVSVKALPPTYALAGLRLVIVGAGGLTVKAALWLAPLTLLTVMLAVPAVAIKLAGTAAITCVGPM